MQCCAIAVAVVVTLNISVTRQAGQPGERIIEPGKPGCWSARLGPGRRRPSNLIIMIIYPSSDYPFILTSTTGVVLSVPEKKVIRLGLCLVF